MKRMLARTVLVLWVAGILGAMLFMVYESGGWPQIGTVALCIFAALTFVWALHASEL